LRVGEFRKNGISPVGGQQEKEERTVTWRICPTVMWGRSAFFDDQEGAGEGREDWKETRRLRCNFIDNHTKRSYKVAAKTSIIKVIYWTSRSALCQSETVGPARAHVATTTRKPKL